MARITSFHTSSNLLRIEISQSAQRYHPHQSTMSAALGSEELTHSLTSVAFSGKPENYKQARLIADPTFQATAAELRAFLDWAQNVQADQLGQDKEYLQSCASELASIFTQLSPSVIQDYLTEAFRQGKPQYVTQQLTTDTDTGKSTRIHLQIPIPVRVFEDLAAMNQALSPDSARQPLVYGSVVREQEIFEQTALLSPPRISTEEETKLRLTGSNFTVEREQHTRVYNTIDARVFPWIPEQELGHLSSAVIAGGSGGVAASTASVAIATATTAVTTDQLLIPSTIEPVFTLPQGCALLFSTPQGRQLQDNSDAGSTDQTKEQIPLGALVQTPSQLREAVNQLQAVRSFLLNFGARAPQPQLGPRMPPIGLKQMFSMQPLCAKPVRCAFVANEFGVHAVQRCLKAIGSSLPEGKEGGEQSSSAPSNPNQTSFEVDLKPTIVLVESPVFRYSRVIQALKTELTWGFAASSWTVELYESVARLKHAFETFLRPYILALPMLSLDSTVLKNLDTVDKAIMKVLSQLDLMSIGRLLTMISDITEFITLGTFTKVAKDFRRSVIRHSDLSRLRTRCLDWLWAAREYRASLVRLLRKHYEPTSDCAQQHDAYAKAIAAGSRASQALEELEEQEAKAYESELEQTSAQAAAHDGDLFSLASSMLQRMLPSAHWADNVKTEIRGLNTCISGVTLFLRRTSWASIEEAQKPKQASSEEFKASTDLGAEFTVDAQSEAQAIKQETVDATPEAATESKTDESQSSLAVRFPLLDSKFHEQASKWPLECAVKDDWLGPVEVFTQMKSQSTGRTSLFVNRDDITALPDTSPEKQCAYSLVQYESGIPLHLLAQPQLLDREVDRLTQVMGETAVFFGGAMAKPLPNTIPNPPISTIQTVSTHIMSALMAGFGYVVSSGSLIGLLDMHRAFVPLDPLGYVKTPRMSSRGKEVARVLRRRWRDKPNPADAFKLRISSNFDAVIDGLNYHHGDDSWVSEPLRAVWRYMFEVGTLVTIELWCEEQLIAADVVHPIGHSIYVATRFVNDAWKHSQPGFLLALLELKLLRDLGFLLWDLGGVDASPAYGYKFIIASIELRPIFLQRFRRVRALGPMVRPAPTPDNPNHCELILFPSPKGTEAIAAAQESDLFDVVIESEQAKAAKRRAAEKLRQQQEQQERRAKKAAAARAKDGKSEHPGEK